MERRLVAVDHDQFGRLEPGNLAAQLRTDRSARARDRDPAALQVVRDRLEIRFNPVAAEQVALDRLTDVDHTDLAAEQLSYRRKHAHVELGPDRDVDELTELGSGGTGNRDDDRGRTLGPSNVFHRMPVAEHADAHVPEVVALGIVVEERDRHVRAFRIAEHGADRALPAVARTEDDDPLTADERRPETPVRLDAPAVADGGPLGRPTLPQNKPEARAPISPSHPHQVPCVPKFGRDWSGCARADSSKRSTTASKRRKSDLFRRHDG